MHVQSRRFRALVALVFAIALHTVALHSPAPVGAEELGDPHDAKRNGAVANANFNLDGVDDYRIDADIAMLQMGNVKTENEEALNLFAEADCVHPDPFNELLWSYSLPDPEDPDWVPSERLNEPGKELPYGCLEDTVQPTPAQDFESLGVAQRGAQLDGHEGYGAVGSGTRIWNVRVLARGLNHGEYIDPETSAATIEGDGLGSLSIAAGSFDCAQSALSGSIPVSESALAEGKLQLRTTSLTLEGEYDECLANGEFFSEVTVNSCHYTLEVLNEGPPYAGALGVACEEEGDAIEFKAYSGEGKGVLFCEAALGPQEAVAGVALATAGQGSSRHVELDAEVQGLEYDVSGPCVGEAETRTDGAIEGEAELLASRDAEQIGVYLVGSESEEELAQPRLNAQVEYLADLSVERIVAGLDWVGDHADQIDVAMLHFQCAQKGDPLVVEAGLDFVACPSGLIDEAVSELVDAGVVPVVQAGNHGFDASVTTPSNSPEAVTVGHVSDTDGKPGGEGLPCGGFPGVDDDKRNPGTATGILVDIAAIGCGDTAGSHGRVAGAAAALASQCGPSDRAGVEYIVDTLMAEGDTGEIAEGGWEDDGGDEWKEPLLNLSSEEVFDPIMIDTESEEPEEQDEDCSWRSHIPESDVDGDGRSDLVAIDHQGESAEVFAGAYEGPALQPAKNGYETADPTTSLAGQLDPALEDGGGHYAVDVADVDGDRHADLITAVGGEPVRVHPGNADGEFEGAIDATGPATLTFDGTEGVNEPIAVADVDGDGRADLVSLLGSAGSLLVFPGEEDGSFGAPIDSDLDLDSALLDGEGSYFLDVIDVTGEELDEPEAEEIDYNARHSNADLVAMDTDGTVYVYPGRPDGKFDAAIEAAQVDPVLDDGEGEEPIGLGDVDRDRRADLLTLDGGTLKLHMATDEGTFEEAIEPYEGEVDSSLLDGEGEEPIGLLDHTRDGLADLVSVTGEGEVLTYAARRDKTFAAPVTSAGSVPSVRGGGAHELLAERPFLRRTGCAEEGCAWTPPAHVPRFHSTYYPATVAGGGPGTFTTSLASFECEESSTEAEMPGPAQRELALSATFGGCQAVLNEEQQLPTAVAMNSCRYTLRALNAGPPHEGGLGVACEEEGDAIELRTYLNKAMTILVCTTRLLPQQPLAGVALSTSGEGAGREVALATEVEGLRYEHSGSHCAQEERTDGALAGETTLAGENAAEQQIPLYIAGEELPLGLYLVGEESGEEAKQPRLEAEGYPLAVAGEGQGEVLAAAGIAVACDQATYGAELAAAAQQLDLEGAYGECQTDLGEGSQLPAAVAMNTCRYILDVQNAGPPYEGALEVVCEEGGDAIEVRTYLNKAMTVLLCTQEIGPQEGIGEVSLANTGEGVERAVQVETDLEGIAYENEGSHCPDEESHTDGAASGDLRLAGVE